MAQLNETVAGMVSVGEINDIIQLRNYVSNLAESFNKLSKDLDFVINGNIDSMNIREKSIHADLISIQTLSQLSTVTGTMDTGFFNNLSGVTIRVDGKQALGSQAIANSGATTLPELVTAYNNLLGALRTMGVLQL